MNINPVGICDFAVSFDEETGAEEFCGADAVCEMWIEDDMIPEARFCEKHRPEIRELA